MARLVGQEGCFRKTLIGYFAGPGKASLQHWLSGGYGEAEPAAEVPAVAAE